MSRFAAVVRSVSLNVPDQEPLQVAELGELPLAGDIGFDVMSAKEIAKARTIFDRMDKDKDEKLNREECALAFRHYGKDPTTQEMNKMMSEIVETNRRNYESKMKIKPKKKEARDEQRDRFEFVDFLTLLHRDLDQGPNDVDELREAFASFDETQNGHITTEQLKAALTQMGLEPMEEEEAEEIVKLADREKDGLINYEEFIKRINQSISD